MSKTQNESDQNKIILLSPDQVLIQESIFNCFIQDKPQDYDHHLNALKHSINTWGQLVPIVVFKDQDHRYHLVDGFKRMAAHASSTEQLPAIVLPKTLTLTDAFIFRLHACPELTAVQKIRIFKTLKMAQTNTTKLMDNILPLMSFEPHKQLVSKLNKTATLSENLLRYCHQKKFSFKQIFRLTHFPEIGRAHV